MTGKERSGSRSKYLVVRQQLLERINQLPEGARLPSENALCDEFGVSRITLRHAVDGLVHNGWLQREQGKGTFVSRPEALEHHAERFANQVTGFHRQQTAAGNTVTTRTLRQALVAATSPITERLDLAPDATVVELLRLRYVNGQLHQMVVTCLSHDRFPGVLTRDLSAGSLFDFLTSEYGVTLVRNDLVVRLELPTSEISLNLEVSADKNLLVIDSTVYDENGPVAFGTAYHAPDHSMIKFSLHTPDPLANTETPS